MMSKGPFQPHHDEILQKGFALVKEANKKNILRRGKVAPGCCIACGQHSAQEGLTAGGLLRASPAFSLHLWGLLCPGVFTWTPQSRGSSEEWRKLFVGKLHHAGFCSKPPNWKPFCGKKLTGTAEVSFHGLFKQYKMPLILSFLHVIQKSMSDYVN